MLSLSLPGSIAAPKGSGSISSAKFDPMLLLTSNQASSATMEETVRTTLTLPYELLEATDKAVSQGKAKSRNEFVARALKHELAALKRIEIDAALAEMAQDPEYQAQVLKMESEFATASWEALQIEESH